MAEYRKKPVVIEAVRFTGDNFDEVAEFVMVRNGDQEVSGQGFGDPHIVIYTLEGEMRADPGDWIIRGVKGEFYPCKPDIFEATYEPVPVSTMGPTQRRAV